MTSIKVKFRPSTVDNRAGSVYYQVIHNRITRQLVTNYQIMAEEWDERHSTVTAKPTGRRVLLISSIREQISCDVERFNRVVNRLDKKIQGYTTDDVVEEFKKYPIEYSFVNYMGRSIIKLRHNGKVGTAVNYRSALNSFRKFLASRAANDGDQSGEDIMLDHIDSELMEQYEAWQQYRGICPNTISFYVRIFRAVYKRAVDEGIIDDRKPFKRVYTGVDKTVKRALPLILISKIKSLDLSQKPKLDFARDMFMMSFYLRGMSFIDMAFLRKSDLKNGIVTYRRRKTGQQLTIAWIKEMQHILDKYPANRSRYLLPILTKPGICERSAYRNVGYNINRSLKQIGALVRSPIPISMYVARHSWASVAKLKGVPLSVISEGMGHENETTTRIYLASLDASVVDRANSLIVSSL